MNNRVQEQKVNKRRGVQPTPLNTYLQFTSLFIVFYLAVGIVSV